jgi:hypothetical protein
MSLAPAQVTDLLVKEDSKRLDNFGDVRDPDRFAQGPICW